jgi:hypothetical protein
MNKMIRYLLITIGVVAISLIIVSVAYALSLGNVDGTWGWVEGIPETSSTSSNGGGAECSRWATGPGDTPTTWSNWDKAVQTGSTTDENQVRYGRDAYWYNDSWHSYSCTNTVFAEQSGFGFNGNNGPLDLAAHTPFYLGSFAHYNNQVFATNDSGDNSNPFLWVDLTVTVPITCDDGTTTTNFSFTPHFVLDETLNQAPCDYPKTTGAPDCPDKVTVTQPGTTATFTCPEGTYTVDILGFTTAGVNGQSCDQSYNSAAVATEYVTQEDQDNKACLWAVITAPTADIAPVKTCNDIGTPNPYYQVVTTNAGPGGAQEVQIVDPLPTGVEYLGYTSQMIDLYGNLVNQGSCSVSGQVVTCKLLTPLAPASVYPNVKWTVKIYVADTTGANTTNTVTASMATTDTNTGNNTSSATCQPTSVELKSFTAAREKDSIVLKWKTASETGNLGFNLYRATSINGARTGLNTQMIPALPGSPSGADYTYTDTELEPGYTYYYWLESVDIHGATSLSGPLLMKTLAGKSH